MTGLPAWPGHGDPGWDDEVIARVDNAQATADRASMIKDDGGNLVVQSGSTLVQYSPDGSQWKQVISNTGVPTWTKVTVADPLPGNPGTGGPISIPPPDNPALLTIGSHTHAINGTNIYRDTDFLVRYTWSPTQTTAPTNQYGVDVVVSSANIVQSVNNRIGGSAQATTSFVSGQYILSGHGLGTGLSGQFLLDYATVGTTVALSGAAGPVPGGGTGTPVPPPVVTGKIFAYWYQIFLMPKINNINSTAMAHVNQVNIALLQSGGAGTGRLNLNVPNLKADGTGNPTTQAEIATQVATWRAAGKNVFMTFGGGSDGGITITNNTQAEDAFESIRHYKEDSPAINFNGIDVDKEPSAGSWTAGPMTHLLTLCRNRWGANFLIQLTPSMYDPYTAQWMSFIKGLGTANYNYVAPMLYDFPEAKFYDQLMYHVRDKMNTLNTAGACPDSKIMLALMLQPWSGYDASPPAVINQVVQTTLAERPALKGVIIWEHSIEHAQGYPIALGPVPGYLGL